MSSLQVLHKLKSEISDLKQVLQEINSLSFIVAIHDYCLAIQEDTLKEKANSLSQVKESKVNLWAICIRN